uniref:PDZ domain-containing RING finger protein 4 n=2 Tax=Schistocephalus solidus TaxID=70667 RepID=A0A0V0J3D8_SCHSO
MVRRRATPRANRSGRKSVVKPVLEDNDDRRFVKPNAISPHLFCPICTEVFNHPYRAPCGHSFCFTCIEPWLKSNSTCPIDRKHVVRTSLHHDFILESIIGDYSVACPWRSLGCSYVGALHLLVAHKKQCVMNPDHLPEALRVRELQALQRAGSSSQLSELILSGSTNTTTTTTTTPINGSCSASADGPTDAADVPAQTSGVFVPEPRTLSAGGQDTVGADGDAAASHRAINDSLNITSMTDEEEEDLPPAPLPSLLFRLYQKSDTDNRNLMCSFFSSEPAIAAPRPPSKRRKRAVPMSERDTFVL